MDALSGVSMAGAQMSQVGMASGPTAAMPDPGVAAAGGSQQISSASASSMSMSASMETMVSSYQASGNKDLMGALLLMLTLEYLRSDDDKKRDGILSLLGTLLQQSGGSGGSSSMMFNSYAMTMESTSMQVVSSGTGINAYSGTGLSTSQAPAVDSASAGLDVVA